MTKQQKLRMCDGCRNNFYNGNNPHGTEECWSLESAEPVMKKEVSIHQRPPWTQKKVLSCYHRQGFVYVGANQTH